MPKCIFAKLLQLKYLQLQDKVN